MINIEFEHRRNDLKKIELDIQKFQEDILRLQKELQKHEKIIFDSRNKFIETSSDGIKSDIKI